MTNEPPEWAGRGARNREGWPNRTFEPQGPPRSHRAPGEVRVPLRRDDDTSEFRPSREPYPSEMPTEEMRRVETRPALPRRPVIKPHFTLEREPDPLVRWNLWVGLAVKVFGLIALLCVIWLLGLTLSHGGVPLWVLRA